MAAVEEPRAVAATVAGKADCASCADARLHACGGVDPQTDEAEHDHEAEMRRYVYVRACTTRVGQVECAMMTP